MAEDCPADPLARYFRRYCRGDVPNVALGLYQLAGYGHVTLARHWKFSDEVYARFRRKTHLGPLSVDRWKPHARAWRELYDWLDGPECFVAPQAWPATWARVLPEHVTPLVWALNYLPDRPQHRLRRAHLARHLVPATLDGLATVTAWAHGWPHVTKDEVAAAVPALEDLMRQVPFLLWAFPRDLSSVALPDVDGGISAVGGGRREIDLFDSYHARERLITNPLSANSNIIRLGLPSYMHTWSALSVLPRRGFTAVGRSSHIVLLAAIHDGERRSFREELARPPHRT